MGHRYAAHPAKALGQSHPRAYHLSRARFAA